MANGLKTIVRRLRASDGRIRIATLAVVSALAVAFALVGGLPALAGSGQATTLLNVKPVVVSYGGGSGACFATFTGRLPSAATKELWINNPMSGIYTGPDGTQVQLTVTNNEYFDFKVINNPSASVFDVVVNGGSQNTHFDYDGNSGPGVTREDHGLHAPTKNNSNNGPVYALGHVNICYDTTYEISGTKFHDRDTDGVLDQTEEPTLPGWTITAFNAAGQGVSGTTGADGTYKLLVPAGTYKVCEKVNTSGLPSPSSGTGFSWAWTQSPLSTTTYPGWGADCSGFSGYLKTGHTVTVGPNKSGVDFANHLQVTVSCQSGTAVQVTLGGSGNLDDPQATVTFPAGCNSTNFTTSFDVGRSDDSDQWTQFVVFGGDPSSSVVLTQTVKWDVEPAVYEDDSLVVPTTLVQLTPGGTLVPVTFCNSASGLPSSSTPQCLDSRTIAEGGSLPANTIQLTETYKVLGDPGNFR